MCVLPLLLKESQAQAWPCVGLISHSCFMKHPKMCTGGTVLSEGWDMKARRCISCPLHPLCCLLSSFSSLFLNFLPFSLSSPPAWFSSSLVLLHFYFFLPFLLVFAAIPQSTLSWQHRTAASFSQLGARKSPLAASDKFISPARSSFLASS